MRMGHAAARRGARRGRHDPPLRSGSAHRGLPRRALSRAAWRRVQVARRRAPCLLPRAALLPRRVQIELRRAFSRVQARATYPRWPVEPALHDLSELILSCSARRSGRAAPVPRAVAERPHVGARADARRRDRGRPRQRSHRMRAVEARRGLPLVVEPRARALRRPRRPRRAICTPMAARSASTACATTAEIWSRSPRCSADCREMRRWAARWGASGFRSPATHRVWEWMPMLGFDYDSSYPDTDPVRADRRRLLHMAAVLQRRPRRAPDHDAAGPHAVRDPASRRAGMWHEKADALRRRGGMALLITHPDYMLDDAQLRRTTSASCGAYRDDTTAWRRSPARGRHLVAPPRRDFDRRRVPRLEDAGSGGWRSRASVSHDRASTLAIRPVNSPTDPETLRPGLTDSDRLEREWRQRDDWHPRHDRTAGDRTRLRRRDHRRRALRAECRGAPDRRGRPGGSRLRRAHVASGRATCRPGCCSARRGPRATCPTRASTSTLDRFGRSRTTRSARPCRWRGSSTTAGGSRASRCPTSTAGRYVGWTWHQRGSGSSSRTASTSGPHGSSSPPGSPRSHGARPSSAVCPTRSCHTRSTIPISRASQAGGSW